MRIRESLHVRTSLRPLGWALICTQVPSLLVLAVNSQAPQKLSSVASHTLRGIGFGIIVGALWYFKVRCPIGQITRKFWQGILGLGIGVGWGGTVLFNYHSGDIGGIPYPGKEDWTGKILIWLSIGILFPFFEELLFRGIVIQELRALRSNRAFLILASALIFLFMHLGMDWVDLIQVLAIGVLLGWMAVKFESLWPGIFLHAGYNSALVLIFLARHP